MNFKKKLSAAEFVVLAEMNTPKGVDISELVTNAKRVKDRVDAVVVPDMDNGMMRMTALAGGALLRRCGLETTVHVYSRDKNRMALQGDVLAGETAAELKKMVQGIKIAALGWEHRLPDILASAGL